MDREELHRLVMLFDKYLRLGRLRFVGDETDALTTSLAKVRIAADGLVDPDSVDTRIRAALLSVAALHSREDVRFAKSLMEIQEEFYGIIQDFFDPLFQQMLKHSVTPYTIAADFVGDEERVKRIDADVQEFLTVIKEFWADVSPAASLLCANLEGAKGVFSSSLFPETGSNLVSRCGLYLDTLFLPDPFLRIASVAAVWSPEVRAREVVRFGLKLLQYREAVLADVDPPIAVILPDQFGTDESYRDLVATTSEQDILKHSALLFGRDFSSEQELREYNSSFTTSHNLVRALARPERLLFDPENRAPLEQQIDEYCANEGQMMKLSGVGDIVYMQTRGRMRQANDALLRSGSVGGVPVIDAETSWRYFNWKLEYDAIGHEVQEEADLHVVHALQKAARGKMKWIGEIPLDALVEIRRSGALDEIRSILGLGVHEIACSEPSDFRATTSRVTMNIQRAFEEHDKRIKELSKREWRFAGRDIGSWLVVGTMEIGAAVLGSPVLASALGVAALAAHELVDVMRLKDMPAMARQLREETRDLKQSAVGLLFSLSKSP